MKICLMHVRLCKSLEHFGLQLSNHAYFDKIYYIIWKVQEKNIKLSYIASLMGVSTES